jgi:hypothetical protein
MDDEQARVLGHPPERHLAHEQRRTLEAQELVGVRRATFLAREVRQLEVEM